MTAADLTRARRPVSYDTGPCEGRQASPSNPSGPQTARLAETVVMRCTTEEKRQLKRRAAADKVSVSELLRGALGQIKTPRRRATPQADPQLVTALSRIGTNLNQIARAVNAARAAGDMRQIDGLQLLAELIGIERQMSSLLASHRQRDTDHVD